jgi:hypothetical protein
MMLWWLTKEDQARGDAEVSKLVCRVGLATISEYELEEVAQPPEKCTSTACDRASHRDFDLFQKRSIAIGCG